MTKNSNLIIGDIGRISDANDATKIGIYRLDKGSSNIPFDLGNTPWIVFNTGQHERIQIAWAYYPWEDNYNIYIRFQFFLNETKWSEWKKLELQNI